MIKVSSINILQDFLEIGQDCVENFKEGNLINKPEQEEMLKFESHALSFWFFQRTSIFPKEIKVLFLDEIHNQYYKSLKRNKYTTELVQAVCDNLNLRYRTYDEALGFNGEFNLIKVGTKFVKFLSDDTKDNLGPEYLIIPSYLIDKLTCKIEEIRNIIK